MHIFESKIVLYMINVYENLNFILNNSICLQLFTSSFEAEASLFDSMSSGFLASANSAFFPVY